MLRNAFFHPAPPAVELRAFTHGLMPKTVPAMMEAFVDDWRARGVDAWNEVPNHWRPGSNEKVGWWTLPAYLGDAFVAPMLNAPPGSVIMQPSVHWTVQALLSAPEVWACGRHVVTTAGAFPSVLHNVQRWDEGLNLDVAVVENGPGDLIDEDALLSAVRSDTALVVVSHVGFTTGEKLTDGFVRRLAARVHEGGGLLALDGYHASAQMPLDVQALDVDVYMGGLLKEGCGSSGNTFVYLRPGLDLTPRLTGWFGDADPFGFEAAPAPHPDVRRRFLGGTTAIAPLYHSVEGLRVLLDAGLDNVAAHIRALTGDALMLAETHGIPVVTPLDAERRAAMLVLAVPDAFRIAEYLKTRQIYVDSRQDRVLRLAPFVWNTSDDVERFFHALVDALRTGAYLSLPLHRSGPVT